MTEEDSRINRINRVLLSQKANMAKMKLFSDDAEETSLSFRGKIIKNNYKYIQKMEKADEMIKIAREVNQEMLEKNKKALKRLEKAHQAPGTLENISEFQEKIVKEQEEKQVKAEIKASSNRQKSVKHGGSKLKEEHANPEPVTNVKMPEQNTADRAPVEAKTSKMSHSLQSVDPAVVKGYFQNKIAQISIETTPQAIYRIFIPFYEMCGIQIQMPLIKKYKNCLYFGEQSNKLSQPYEGFLVFSNENKIFYGELLNDKKHGQGVQLDFKQNIIYAGLFSGGKKNGEFTVIRDHETYVGQLKRGFYHGFGVLTTDFSVYRGFFEEGMRNGRGEEQFGSGLAIEGEFYKNKFTNLIRDDPSRTNTIATSHRKDETSISHLKSSQKKQFSPKPFQNEVLNPESLHVSIKCDSNVEFEPSPLKNNNYQEFNYRFDEDDLAQTFAAHNVKHSSSFRIKESPKPSLSKDRRRTASNWQSLAQRA